MAPDTKIPALLKGREPSRGTTLGSTVTLPSGSPSDPAVPSWDVQPGSYCETRSGTLSDALPGTDLPDSPLNRRSGCSGASSAPLSLPGFHHPRIAGMRHRGAYYSPSTRYVYLAGATIAWPWRPRQRFGWRRIV